MALTDDQKAMLRLLSQRGEEGYDDIAALMGIGVEEVRERVREALAAAADEQPAAERAPEPPPTSTPATPSEPTPEPAKAKEPPSPAAPKPQAPTSTATAAAPKPKAARMPRPRLPKDRGALVGLGAGVLVLVVIAIVLAIGGSDSGSDSSTTASSAEGASTTASNSSLTEAILAPTDGGEGSGKALFGRYKKNVLLQVEAEGLAPSPQGKAYSIWLYRSPKIALQIGAVPVDDSGKIASQFQIPAQLLAYVASGAFNQVDIALTDTAEYKAALNEAKGEKKLPPYTGESVLRGEVTGPAIR